ncbi:MAG: PIG-L family deacetylase [Armatimonadetes bacterium]|nr:PIG-L family deacetylase [Armatimonadota bacterium]
MSDRRVLVIAAHPDDEILGCGGALALHSRNGDEVSVLIVCEGESVRYGAEDGVDQAACTRRAADILGISQVCELGFPDQKLDTVPSIDLIRPIEELVASFCPHVVYSQFGGDVNRDHQLLFKAVLVAARPTQKGLETLLVFDTASSTEWSFPRAFVPDTFVDISTTLDLKLRAMAEYDTEVREYPHPRSLESLRYRAHAWGNQVCLDAAEAFMTVRRICSDGAAPV